MKRFVGLLLWCLGVMGIVCVSFGHSLFAAADFENFDEFSVPNDDDEFEDADHTAMPEIESEQHDLRIENQNSLGLSIGESMPHVSLALEYQRNLGLQDGFFLLGGRGASSSTVQESGESPFVNKMSTSALAGGYLWWPSPNFPFATAANVTWLRVDGKMRASGEDTGHYSAQVLGLGADLQLETFFENRFWLKWVVISMNYYKAVTGSHSDISDSRYKTVTKAFSGLKIVGVANITAGYAW